MRILVVNYRDRLHPLAGGAEVHLHKIFGALAQQGHSVFLLTTLFGGAPEQESLDGIEVIRKGGDWNFQYTVAKHLGQIVKKNSIEVVVEDLNKLPVYAPLFCDVPVLVQMHHLWGSSIFYEANPLVAAVVWLFERSIPLFYKKQRFVVVSPSTAAELMQIGVPKEKISVIYNGFEQSFGPALGAPSPAVALHKPYFLWLGRIRKYKGIHIALQAFAKFSQQYPEYTLVVTGDGPHREAMQNLAQKIGIASKVVFTGFVENALKIELLQHARAVLQTSRKEGWGLTVMEANACGVPAIASRVPGLQDSVIHDHTGLLFTHGDSDALLECMQTIAQNELVYAKLAGNTMQHAASFSWQESAQQTQALLQQIVMEPSEVQMNTMVKDRG